MSYLNDKQWCLVQVVEVEGRYVREAERACCSASTIGTAHTILMSTACSTESVNTALKLFSTLFCYACVLSLQLVSPHHSIHRYQALAMCVALALPTKELNQNGGNIRQMQTIQNMSSATKAKMSVLLNEKGQQLQSTQLFPEERPFTTTGEVTRVSWRMVTRSHWQRN